MGYFIMGHKHDMYIKYESSYKKQRRGKFKWWYILPFILVIAGLAALILTIKIPSNNSDIEPFTLTPTPSTTPTEAPTITTKPTPSPTPTPMPTPVGIDDTTQAPSEETLPTYNTGINSEVETSLEDPRTPTQVKGIYITSSVTGTSRFEDLITLTQSTEVNAMVIDIKDDFGKISYMMDSPIAKEIGAVTNNISDMKALIAALKEKNIYLIARIVAFKDPYLAKMRQDLAIKNKDGSLFLDNNKEGWVNPYNKEVWDYLVEVASQAAAIGFDEIQFDYIRFSTGKSIQNADFGKEAITKTKEDIITEFTKYAYEQLKPLGVYVSADVYGTIINSSIDAALVGQNYVEMAKYLDYICPMIYPSHFGEGNYGIQYPDTEPYNIIYKVLSVSKEKLDAIPEGEHRAIVRPWLQDFTASWVKNYIKYGGEELRAQIDGVYDAKYEEWLLWNASCRYSTEGLLVK